MSTKEIEDNDRIYQNLRHLHKQDHDKDNCFCTTEISGAYKNILDEVNRLASQKALEARIDEINRFFDHTMSKDWQDNATYSDNRIAALKQESEG